MDEKYIDVDIDGTTFRMSEAAVRSFLDAQEYFDEHLAALGMLCLSWAGLDRAVDFLFQPLLQCSEEQVACIVQENIGARTAQLTRLLHLETKLRPNFVDWACDLLKRIGGELANERNRYIHDRWELQVSGDKRSAQRIVKKPQLGKSQSRQRPKVQINTRFSTDAEDIERLSGRIATVSAALWIADNSLRTWRQTKRLPKLDPQWLPASKPKARALIGGLTPEVPGPPPPPSAYEFD